MTSTALWLTLIAGGVITYAIRLSLILAWGRVTLPPVLQRGLRFVPPAVLSAIIFPEILRPDGALDLSFGNVRLLAGVIAALVAWRTKNALLDHRCGDGGVVDFAGSHVVEGEAFPPRRAVAARSSCDAVALRYDKSTQECLAPTLL